MRNILLIISLLLCLNSTAQTSDCSFLNNINYKDGIGVILIKAELTEVGLRSDSPILTKLEKEGKLNEKDFGFAILLQPENCKSKYYVSCKDTSDLAKGLFTYTTPHCYQVTLTVFQKYKIFDCPFFVINKIDTLQKKE